MDQSIENNNQNPKWFNDFIEDYDYQSPKSGQILEGTVIHIEDDAILVDVGLKRDAVVPSRDISQLEQEFLSDLNIGDQVLVYVINTPSGDRDLLVSLNKGIEYENWEKAEQYLKDGTILELEVVGHNRGGLIIQYESLRGFLPYSQIPELRQTRDPRMIDRIKREVVGSTMEMKVIEVVRRRNRLIFSAWAAKAEKRQKRLQELEKGQIIHGKVTSVVDFGIFVDLDGVDGLVHISQLDWQRVEHPSDLYKVGEEIDVQILDIDIERERVSLSRKALLPSPWDEVAEKFQPGECIEGRVMKIVDFGVFVEVIPGVEGLVHNSQLGYSASQDARSTVKQGELVLVRILNVDTQRERISLSMRQVPLEKQIAWAIENLEESPEDTSESTSTPEEEPLDQTDTETTDTLTQAAPNAESAPSSEDETQPMPSDALPPQQAAVETTDEPEPAESTLEETEPVIEAEQDDPVDDVPVEAIADIEDTLLEQASDASEDDDKPEGA
jgi:small subunit ribosomal protein S1